MPIRRTKVDLRSMFVRVTKDEDLVVRALDNLVENAVRHARNVTLSATGDGDEILLQVTDDGPGIPDDLRATLFVQVTTPGAPSRGSNRGLTFVRLVAQEHGGDATVDCPSSGGTVFTLRFAAG
jgi:signal transduction histidine kinase